MYDYKANGISLKFKDVEVGEYFKEDNSDVSEVFQKIDQFHAMPLGETEEVYVGQDFPIVLVDYR